MEGDPAGQRVLKKNFSVLYNVYSYFVLHGPNRDEGGGLDDDFHGNNSDDSRPNSNQSSCVITKEQVSDNK